MKARIQELLRAVPFQPFIIRLADGRTHYLSVLLIASIEKSAATAGR